MRLCCSMSTELVTSAWLQLAGYLCQLMLNACFYIADVVGSSCHPWEENKNHEPLIVGYTCCPISVAGGF